MIFLLTKRKGKFDLPQRATNTHLRGTFRRTSLPQRLVQSTQKRHRFFYTCTTCTKHAILTECSLLRAHFSRNKRGHAKRVMMPRLVRHRLHLPYGKTDESSTMRIDAMLVGSHRGLSRTRVACHDANRCDVWWVHTRQEQAPALPVGGTLFARPCRAGACSRRALYAITMWLPSASLCRDWRPRKERSDGLAKPQSGKRPVRSIVRNYNAATQGLPAEGGGTRMRDGGSSGNFILYTRHKPSVSFIVARTPSVACGASSLTEGAILFALAL